MEELRLRMEEEARSQAEKENLMGDRQTLASDERYGSSAYAVASKRHSPPLSSRSAVPTSQRLQSALQGRTPASYPSSSGLSRPLVDVPVPPQRVSRATRLVKYASHNGGFDRIPETEGFESEYGYGYHTGEETDTGMFSTSCSR